VSRVPARPSARWLPPLALAAGLIAAAPFLGELRDLLLRVAPERFLLILGAGFALALAAAVALAVARIRERRLPRYAAVVAALAFAGWQLAALSTGQARVNAVERLHILAYGALAFLFVRALLPRSAAPAFVLAFLATTAVGTLDEWLQWLVPVRVGEIRDVRLNAASAVPGLLFAWAVLGERPVPWRLSRAALRRCLLAAAATGVLLAAFYDCAHLGHRIVEPGLGTFLSYHSRDGLARAAADRARRWRTDPPLGLVPLAREDYFLTEATWRVAHRNAARDRGDLAAAWMENLILERFYDPVLDLRSFQSGAVHRWPETVRAEVERLRPRPDRVPYHSHVLGHRIDPRGAGRFWAATAAVVAALLAAAWWLGRRPAAEAGFRSCGAGGPRGPGA
jgi:hypothetical protein